MTELELLESINKSVTANAICTGFLLMIFVLLLFIKFTEKFDIIYRGDNKK